MAVNLETAGSKWDKQLAIWEVASVIVSCLIAEWVVIAFVGKNKLVMAIPVILAIAFMIVSHRERGESLKNIGFRIDNFAPALRLLFLPTILAVALVVVFAFLFRPFAMASLRPRFLVLPLWALFQQYALNGFINRRFQIAFGKGTPSILLLAAVFGMLHLPNPLLVAITCLGALVWGWAYQRAPNLFALAISHSIVSLTLALMFPSAPINSLRVGFKYFGLFDFFATF